MKNSMNLAFHDCQRYSLKAVGSLLLLFSFILISHSGFSQQSSGWKFLGEDQANHVDVDYMIDNCGPAGSSVFLSVFNEASTSRSIAFTITLTDANGSQSFQVSHNYGVGEIVKADCNSNAALKIAIPASMDVSTLQVSITF